MPSLGKQMAQVLGVGARQTGKVKKLPPDWQAAESVADAVYSPKVETQQWGGLGTASWDDWNGRVREPRTVPNRQTKGKRDARAKKLGFTVEAYKGSAQPIDLTQGRKIWWFSSKPAPANTYVPMRDDPDAVIDPNNWSIPSVPKESSMVTKVRLRPGKVLEVEGDGATWGAIPVKGIKDPEAQNRFSHTAATDDIAEWARRQGYDSVRFKNIYDNKYGQHDAELTDVWTIFKAQNIRSVNANYHKRNRGRAMLMGGGLVGAGLAAQTGGKDGEEA